VADPAITQGQQDSIAEVCGVTNIRFVLLPDMVDSLGDLCKGLSSTGEAAGQISEKTDSAGPEHLASREAAPAVHRL
jgi:hypothetical protein